jgi:Leucine-rich repeat (LRR) protein
LDIEKQFAKGKKIYEINSETFEFYKFVRDISQGEPWLEIKNNHIVGLYLNYFNWLFLKENPEFINSSKWLRYPNMFLNSLRKMKIDDNDIFEVPDTIGLLTSLEWLDLSRNNLQKIPESLSKLKSLKKLDLSHNKIEKIPISLDSFIRSLESFKY